MDNADHHTDQAPFEMEEDCFACDFDLGYFTNSTPCFSSILKRIHCADAVEVLARLSDENGHSVSLRGPPVTV